MIKCSCHWSCKGKIEITANYMADLIYISMENNIGGFASVYLSASATEKLILELQEALKELEK